MMRLSVAGALAAITLAAGLTISAQEKPSAPEKPFVPVTDEMLWKPNPADWLMWRRTLDSWGYSPLDEVNRNNVGKLKMVWTRGIVSGRTQEATPLVYNGTIYIPNPGDIIMHSDTSRMTYGKSSWLGRTGTSARSARLPCPMSRRLGPRIGLFSPVEYGGKL